MCPIKPMKLQSFFLFFVAYLKDSRIKETKVGKDSATMYRVITVFMLASIFILVAFLVLVFVEILRETYIQCFFLSNFKRMELHMNYVKKQFLKKIFFWIAIFSKIFRGSILQFKTRCS